MNTWFRFYNQARTDPKVQTLPPAVFKHWVNLLCLASECGGVMPAKAEIAYELRLSLKQTDALVDELIQRRLLDHRPDGRLEPHNWEGRQFKSDLSTDRVKKFRERARDGPQAPPGNTDRNAGVTEKTVSGNANGNTIGNTIGNMRETPPDFRSFPSGSQITEEFVRPRISNLIEREAVNDAAEERTNERTNGSNSEFQKFWGPVEGYLRRQVSEESFREKYAGWRIVDMNSRHVVLAVPQKLLAQWGNLEAAQIMIAVTIEKASTGLLRGRKVKLVRLEED